MNKYDIVVVGAGPAGLNASKVASRKGYKTLLVERDERLGGILNQCIHNGFGLKFFKEELTGPEFVHKMLEDLKNDNLDILTNTFVTDIKRGCVEITNESGVQKIKCSAVILATGARERTAGGVSLLGARPAGVYTAGFAQKMINHHGKLVGKKAVILGSGDIGLILARRLKFEGAEVVGIFEIGKTSAGLQRNIRQCVEDFDIPLQYSTTIVEVVGKERVEGVWVAEVDENKKPILQTKRFVECDCVLLSVGLIPETELLKNKIDFFEKSNNATVDENRMTSLGGVFVAGNCLHIHDLADNAAEEGEIAALGAIDYINKSSKNKTFNISAGDGVSYCIPQKIHENARDVNIFFRVKTKLKKAKIKVAQNGNVIAEKFCPAILPGSMQEIELKNYTAGDLVVFVEGEKQ
ncbi:MAG: NAD(P)/FAD-dependent oxidoreductase [Christensenellales bacterium]